MGAAPRPRAVSPEVEIHGALTVSHRNPPERHSRFKQTQGRSKPTNGVKTKGTCDASAPLPINLLPFTLKELIDGECIFQYISPIQNWRDLGHEFPGGRGLGRGRADRAPTPAAAATRILCFHSVFFRQHCHSPRLQRSGEGLSERTRTPQEEGEVSDRRDPSGAAAGRDIQAPCRTRQRRCDFTKLSREVTAVSTDLRGTRCKPNKGRAEKAKRTYCYFSFEVTDFLRLNMREDALITILCLIASFLSLSPEGKLLFVKT